MTRIKLILLFLLAGFYGHAQTPMFSKGGGTNANSFPWNSATVLKTQNIYLPGDIITSPTGGNINRIYLRSSVVSGTATFSNLNINLGQTTATAFATSGTTFFTGLTNAYTAATVTLTSAAVGGNWYYIDLTTPYLYDPTKTLIVEITFTAKTAGGFTSLTTVGPAAPNNKRIHSTSIAAATGTTATAWMDLGIDVIPPVACVAPTDQATGLTLTPVSSSQINGSFTAAVSAPSGYLVVRYPNGSVITDPTDATNYTVGGSLGLGTIVYSGASTTFNSAGLSGGSSYDYYIYTYNNTLCGGGPKYNITTPLTGTASTSACSTMTGTFSVGPTGTYTSLTSALSTISSNGIGGPVILELQAAYNSSVETFPITFPLNACVTAVKTLTIRPELGATALSIVNSAATPTLSFDGGANITFDGRPGGVGTIGQLLISNTGVAAPAIAMANEASNNTFTYCEIAANNAGLAGVAGAGIIDIEGTTGLFGNDNITISNCSIHNVTGGNPACAINVIGNNSTTASHNDNLIITDCLIFDYFNAAGFNGIYLGSGTNACSITNNHFYQTASRTMTGTVASRDLYINNATNNTNGSGYIISGNYFGGNSATGTGVYTLTGTSTHAYNSAVIGVGIGTTTSIQNNTFTNMSMTSANTSAVSMSCLYITAGNVDAGTVTGNVIGAANTDASTSPAITFTNTGTSGGGFIPLFAASGTINASNNIIAGIQLVGSPTSMADFNAIASNNGNLTLNNNTIGSANTPKSIYYATAGSASSGTARFNGILISVTAAYNAVNITNNLIANMYSMNDAVATSNTARGISLIGTFAAGNNLFNISNNIIRDFSAASNNPSIGATAAIAGISLATTGASGTYTVSQNSIYNLKSVSASTTAVTQISGIVFAGVPVSGINSNLITRNNIHSLSYAAVNTAAFINGIDMVSGTITYANNMIRLGIDGDGNSMTTAAVIRGFNKASTVNSNIYFNSVYVGGTGVGTAAKNTFAFYKASTGADDIRNNIFVNNRSNATTGGKHYQIGIANFTAVTLNYNNYFGNGTGAVFALNGATDVATYTPTWTATDGNSKNYDPFYLNPTGDAASVDLHINPIPASPIESTGTPIATITEDYDGQLRSGLTPTDMGADAVNLISMFICSSGNVGGTVAALPNSICEGTTSTISLTGFDYNITGISYQWKVSSTPGGPYTNVTGGSGATTPVYTTDALTNGMYYYVLETTCSNCGPCSLLSPEVSLEVYTITAPSAISTSQCGPGIPTVSVATTGTGSGQYYWYDAASAGNLVQGPSMSTYYTNDFSSATLTNSSINGNASISGGDLKLHPNALSQYGAFQVNAGPNSSRYQVDFDLTTLGVPTNMADGFSYSFADDAVNTVEAGMNAENGTGSKLKVAFVAYGTGVTGIFLMYNCTTNEQTSATSGVLAYSTDVTWRGTANNHVKLTIDDFGKATLKLNSTTIFNNVQLPAGYVSANRSTWKHVFKGRSGGIAMGTTLDNVSILYSDPAPGYTTYLSPIATTTTFYVSERGTNGCYSARTPVTATVLPLPTVTAAPFTSTVCEGYPVTLSGGGTATSFTWTGGITDATPFAATTSTTYTVTGSDGTCSSTATASVVVNPVMTGTASATPSSFCIGGTATLDASVASVCPPTNVTGFSGYYDWSNWTLDNSQGGSLNIAGSPSSLQIISSASNLGNTPVTSITRTITCTGNGTVSFNWSFTHPDVGVFHMPRYKKNTTVTVFPSYNQSAAAGTQTGTITIPVVAGDVISLEAFSQDDSQPATLTVSNFSAPAGQESGTVTYWSDPTGGTNLGAPPINVTPTTSGANVYYAEYTVTSTGCVNLVRTPVTVTANALPVIAFTPAVPNVCDGSPLTLAGTGAGLNGTYVWTGGIDDNVAFLPTMNASYMVTGTDANNCSNTAMANVVINPLPVITATPTSTTVCQGSDVTLSGGGAGVTGVYSWTGGITDATPFSAMTVGPTIYTVTGTDGNNCSNTASATVNVNAAPAITASASAATTCINTTVAVTGGGAGVGGFYTWTPAVSDNTPFAIQTSGFYSVVGTDANSCTGVASVFVNVDAASGDLSNATSSNALSNAGLSSDTDTQPANSMVSYYSGSCNLILSIKNNPASLGLTTSTVTVENSVLEHHGQPFVPRWFQIQPATNGSADVDFYLTQDDFDDYNGYATTNGWPLLPTGPTDAAGIANLRVTKNDNAGMGINPVVIQPTNVNWDALTNYWVVTVPTPSFSQFRFHSLNPLNAALSVVVEKFEGRKYQNSDLLEWSTSSEQNNAYFNLQYSTDGSNFKNIGRVNSKSINGNSQVPLQYSFTNTTPVAGHNYYRLQQVDLDGKSSVHSKVVDLIWSSTGTVVSLYPNPVQDVLQIDLNAAKTQRTTVTVSDMSGRIMKQVQLNSVKGMNHLEINLSEIASGLYFVQVYENDSLISASKVKKN